MRREKLYLRDILEAADHIAEFVRDIDFPAFQKSELVRSAVVQKLAVIGEAAARISAEPKTRSPHIPWSKIVALRNIVVHAYFGVDWNEVWRTVQHDCPVLREQVAAILTREFGQR
jgi:uncharacterized protein with HEPN domain